VVSPIPPEPDLTGRQHAFRYTERKGDPRMYREFYSAQDRVLREQEFAERVAERNRHARPADRPSVRARVARRLFELAVVTERQETWKVVWEKLEAKGRL
jgi:hypothetical protein